MADGLAALLPAENFSVVVNIGDDFEYWGLPISPDLDTVCYTLANLSNEVTGWGRKDETWHVFDAMAGISEQNWFHIGDKDLSTHLYRHRTMRDGATLSHVTSELCAKWGIRHKVLPVSDQKVPTIVHTKQGEILAFQDYFVRLRCEPEVASFEFQNIDDARPLAEVLALVQGADAIIICPSNPWVSVQPILAIPGMLEEVKKKLVVAVSPIVGGKAIKGPAAKMYQELGIDPSAAAVARHYQDLLSGFVFDMQDDAEESNILKYVKKALCTDTIMKNREDRLKLAEEVLQFIETL